MICCLCAMPTDKETQTTDTPPPPNLYIIDCPYQMSRKKIRKLVYSLQSDGDYFGDAFIFHGDAVHGIRALHGEPVVGDEEDLRFACNGLDDLHERCEVGVVERSIDLVHEREG